MNSLAEMLKQHHTEIIQYLYLGYIRWDELIKRIEKQEQVPSSDFYDEQIWTFLLSCGYAAAGKQGLSLLTKTLTGSDQLQLNDQKIWLEVLPIAPRKMEGETHLDLAVKDHVNSPPLGSRYFPTFGGEGVDDFGLSFFRYDSPSITR